jgi:hypothetical protein
MGHFRRFVQRRTNELQRLATTLLWVLQHSLSRRGMCSPDNSFIFADPACRCPIRLFPLPLDEGLSAICPSNAVRALPGRHSLEQHCSPRSLPPIELTRLLALFLSGIGLNNTVHAVSRWQLSEQCCSRYFRLSIERTLLFGLFLYANAANNIVQRRPICQPLEQHCSPTSRLAID